MGDRSQAHDNRAERGLPSVTLTLLLIGAVCSLSGAFLFYRAWFMSAAHWYYRLGTTYRHRSAEFMGYPVEWLLMIGALIAVPAIAMFVLIRAWNVYGLKGQMQDACSAHNRLALVLVMLHILIWIWMPFIYFMPIVAAGVFFSPLIPLDIIALIGFCTLLAATGTPLYFLSRIVMRCTGRALGIELPTT